MSILRECGCALFWVSYGVVMTVVVVEAMKWIES